MLKTGSSAPQNLTRMNPGAAAIDIGSTMHMAAVNPDSDDMPIRAFGTFTPDLHELAAWFRSCGVPSVAMESTGVYRIPAFEILQQNGFEVIPVNACYAKNVSTRCERQRQHAHIPAGRSPRGWPRSHLRAALCASVPIFR